MSSALGRAARLGQTSSLAARAGTARAPAASALCVKRFKQFTPTPLPKNKYVQEWAGLNENVYEQFKYDTKTSLGLLFLVGFCPMAVYTLIRDGRYRKDQAAGQEREYL